MTQLRIREAAGLLGVSDDTVRRWIAQGVLAAGRDAGGRQVVEGVDVARVAQRHAPGEAGRRAASSARNRFTGLVTEVRQDAVMAQVELQCGPFRVVSLMSSEAVEELGLVPGAVAVAVVKSTNVIVEVPEPRS